MYTENLNQDFMLSEKATAHGQDYQRICHRWKERNFIQVSSRKHCCHGGWHWSPYFIVLLYRNEHWRIIFSVWAKGKFNKATSGLGVEPRPHWWEACALTTLPSHHPGAGVNEKPKDKWWFDKRTWNDWKTTSDLAALYDSVCRDESCDAIAHRC